MPAPAARRSRNSSRRCASPPETRTPARWRGNRSARRSTANRRPARSNGRRSGRRRRSRRPWRAPSGSTPREIVQAARGRSPPPSECTIFSARRLGHAHVAPFIAIGFCHARLDRADGERRGAALHARGSRQRDLGRQRAQRSHSQLPPLARLDAAASELLRHHARGRGGVEAALSSRQPSHPLPGARLGVELDEEEETNSQSGMPYTLYPCPVAAPYPPRALVLRIVDAKAPTCRR